MTGQTHHSELIDKYLSGHMSPAEQADFEIMMESDPLLKEEFNFQNDIVGQIKEYRKSQLKGRLNQISVGVGVTGLLLNSGIAKLVAAVGTLGILGIGGYVAVEEFSTDDVAGKDNVSILAIDEDIDSPKQFNLETFSIEMNDENGLVEETDSKSGIENKLSPTKTTKATLAVVESNKKTNPVTEETKVATELSEDIKSNNIRKPNFTVPALDNLGDDEETLQGISITLPDADQPVTTKEAIKKEIEVENITQTKYDLHYKFFSGKLYLYGDFNSIPYELIEINSGANRKLFLYHDGVYYSLRQFEYNVVPLKVLADEELIQELEIIRNNKID